MERPKLHQPRGANLVVRMDTTVWQAIHRQPKQTYDYQVNNALTMSACILANASSNCKCRNSLRIQVLTTSLVCLKKQGNDFVALFLKNSKESSVIY